MPETPNNRRWLFDREVISEWNHVGQRIAFFGIRVPLELELVFMGYQDVHLQFSWEQRIELAKLFDAKVTRVDSTAVNGFAEAKPSHGELWLYVQNDDEDDGTAIHVRLEDGRKIAASLRRLNLESLQQ